ncbi:MAG: hypothetical protein KKD18_04405, partial [Nanoarchaeota archaeon]|nr:hypothetical protein [Nanoarchaeota archaeon]
VSVRQAADFLRYGAARLVESEEEGVQMNRADFYKAVGEGIKRAGHHEDALYALEKDGYLEPEEREDIRGRIEGRAHSYLENKVAAIWLFMVIGAILMLISGFTMTGAAIGSVFDVSLLFIIGFALFVIGFVLRIKK